MDSRSDKKRRKKKFKTLVRNIVHQLHTLGYAGQKYTIKNSWTIMLVILRWQPEKKNKKSEVLKIHNTFIKFQTAARRTFIKLIK